MSDAESWYMHRDRAPESKPPAAKREIPAVGLSVDEAAEAIGVSRRFMENLLTRGVLPSIKFGARRIVPVGPLKRRLAEMAEHGEKCREAGQGARGGSEAEGYATAAEGGEA